MKKTFFSLCVILGSFAAASAQTINVNGIEVDHRIYFDHSQAQVADLIKNNPQEIRKLNYYHSKSYTFVPSTQANAPAFDLGTLNISRFEAQRSENEQTTIMLSAFEDKLIMKSKKEMAAEMAAIK